MCIFEQASSRFLQLVPTTMFVSCLLVGCLMNDDRGGDPEDAESDGSVELDVSGDAVDSSAGDDSYPGDGSGLSRCCPVSEFPPDCFGEFWDGPQLWPVGGLRLTADQIAAGEFTSFPHDPGRYDETGCRMGFVNYASPEWYVTDDDDGCPFWRPTRGGTCGLPTPDTGFDHPPLPDAGNNDSEVSE